MLTWGTSYEELINGGLVQIFTEQCSNLLAKVQFFLAHVYRICKCWGASMLWNSLLWIVFVHTKSNKRVKISKPANKIPITDSLGSARFINLLIVIIIIIITTHCYKSSFGLQHSLMYSTNEWYARHWWKSKEQSYLVKLTFQETGHKQDKQVNCKCWIKSEAGKGDRKQEGEGWGMVCNFG